MTLGPKIIEVLLKFSEQFAKLPPFSETDSKEVKLSRTQGEWYAGAEPSLLPNIYRLIKDEIDASTGSSAFTPDEKIVEEISALSPALLPEYHNHVPQKDYVKAIENYFQQIGIINKSTTLKQDVYGEGQSTDYYSMIGAGTTQLFAASIKSVIKSKGDVVIFAAPTYGLFLPSVLSAQAKIVTLELSQKNHYKPSASELKKLIQDTQVDLNKDFLKKLSSTTILLNGLLASLKIKLAEKLKILKTIDSISALLKKANDNLAEIDAACEAYHQTLSQLLATHYSVDEAKNLQDSLSLAPCPRVRAYFHINPHMPMSTICDQKEVDQLAKTLQEFKDVIVYDDLSYYDLILPDAKTKVGTFAKSPLKDRALTLYSISKQFALAAARAGLALGPKFLIDPIVHDIFESTNSPNILTLNAVYSTMIWKKEARTQYLKETLEEYSFRRDFTIGLIEGLNENHPRYEQIEKHLSNLKITKTEQKELLKGIPHLKIVLKPNSGFVLLIDLSNFKGQYLGKAQLNCSRDFRHAFQALADVNSIPGELMYSFDKPILRFAYSMEPKEILEGLLRIKTVLSFMRSTPLSNKEIPKKKEALKNNKKLLACPSKQVTEKESAKVYLPLFDKGKKASKAKIKLPKASLNRGHNKRKIIPTTHP